MIVVLFGVVWRSTKSKICKPYNASNSEIFQNETWLNCRAWPFSWTCPIWKLTKHDSPNFTCLTFLFQAANPSNSVHISTNASRRTLPGQSLSPTLNSLQGPDLMSHSCLAYSPTKLQKHGKHPPLQNVSLSTLLDNPSKTCSSSPCIVQCRSNYRIVSDDQSFPIKMFPYLNLNAAIPFGTLDPTLSLARDGFHEIFLRCSFLSRQHHRVRLGDWKVKGWRVELSGRDGIIMPTTK